MIADLSECGDLSQVIEALLRASAEAAPSTLTLEQEAGRALARLTTETFVATQAFPQETLRALLGAVASRLVPESPHGGSADLLIHGSTASVRLRNSQELGYSLSVELRPGSPA